MRIAIVTFTGADETVKPEELIKINEDYPDLNIEWGLLLSKSNKGRSRYPAQPWMEELCASLPQAISLAGHIQGQWLREMVEGNFTLATTHAVIWERLNRVQLNFHSVPTFVNGAFWLTLLKHATKQFIIQMDGINDAIFVNALIGITEGDKLNVVPLFDKSAGAGIVPEQWPLPMFCEINGYAGGLGPVNIMDELTRIAAVAGESLIWADMESSLRSSDDKFDLGKCRQVLDGVREFVNK